MNFDGAIKSLSDDIGLEVPFPQIYAPKWEPEFAGPDHRKSLFRKKVGNLKSTTFPSFEVIITMHLKARLVSYILLSLGTYSVVSDLVPPPTDGLHGKSNYIFNAGGANIQRLQATLYFQDDFVSESNGVGFQLNCYSPTSGNNGVLVQQYGFQMLTDNSIYAFIETWSSDAESVIERRFFVTYIVVPQTIVAGSSFVITLVTDGNNVVNQATFNASLSGVNFSVLPDPLEDLVPTPSPGTDNDLAPITAFTFNIVGDDEGNTAVFSAGSGYLQFESSNSIEPLSDFPSNVAGAYTTEDGNSVYDQMDDGSATEIFQYWSVGNSS